MKYYTDIATYFIYIAFFIIVKYNNKMYTLMEKW